MICANSDCTKEKEFTPKTHNQKYCGEECCRIATNKKIMEKYYEKKAIRSGQKRYCSICKSPLSRYNTLSVCSKCEKNNSIAERKKIIGMINDAC